MHALLLQHLPSVSDTNEIFPVQAHRCTPMPPAPKANSISTAHATIMPDNRFIPIINYCAQETPTTPFYCAIPCKKLIRITKKKRIFASKQQFPPKFTTDYK